MENKFDQINDRINQLEKKTIQLVEKYHRIAAKCTQLEEKNQYLQTEIEQKEEQLRNFYNQDKITKIVSSIADDSLSKSELKIKINEFIREIDKCIATLSD
jgi:predicted nuclease with TOPRIM domain